MLRATKDSLARSSPGAVAQKHTMRQCLAVVEACQAVVRAVHRAQGQLRYANPNRPLCPIDRSLLTLAHTPGMLVLVGLFCRIIGLFCLIIGLF